MKKDLKAVIVSTVMILVGFIFTNSFTIENKQVRGIFGIVFIVGLIVFSLSLWHYLTHNNHHGKS